MRRSKTTPMIKQYLSIKERYADAILFYRMGDFYEMFFDDAVTASKELEITLTSRNKKDEAAIPMCGVPVRAADAYVGRLIRKGYKVAICEQIEDPALAKGLVKRDVVRVCRVDKYRIKIMDNIAPECLAFFTNRYSINKEEIDPLVIVLRSSIVDLERFSHLLAVARVGA